MALNFPSSPSINDTYTYGDKTWVWNGRFWQIQAAGAINDIAIGNITPNTGAFTTLSSTGNITAAGNISANVLSGNFYANSILPWSPTAGLIDDAVDIGNSSLYFKDIYVGNVITPAGNQGNATQIQPASGAGQSGIAFVDAITGSATDVSAGTLYVESIDGTGNIIVDTFVEANEIIALSNVSGTGGNFSANVTAAYFFGNGAFLTGISAGSSYSNANVAAYLPNYQGLISNVDFRSTSPAAVAMVVTDRPITIGGNTLSYVTIPNDGNANSVAAELTNHGLGNVLISSGPADYEWVFDNAGNLLAPGNIQAGNAVSANYFLGNGALLSGITTNYSNANVANYLATYNGNALFSNVTVSQDAVILGNLRVEGNTTYINVNDLVVDDYLVIIGNAATQVSDLNGAGLQIGNLANSNIQFVYDYTSNVMTLNRGANIANVLNVAGNVTANNFVGSGSNVTLAADSYTWIFNNAGNLVLPGNTFAVNYANGTAVSLDGSYSNANVANYLASNANVTVSVGTGNITTQGNISGNYFIGNGALLTGIVTSSYSNANVANYLASNANLTISVGTGNITTQGNVTGNYFIGNGALLTGIVTSSYSNANVANYLPTYTGNVTAGNISVTGNVTANWFVGNINTTNSLITSGNVTANNFIGSDPNVNLIAGGYTWAFNDAGNLVLPSNTFAVNYANGVQVSLGGTYSNADVANYLASNANVTITVGVSNITTQGNISGNYFIGNGALLTGVVTSSYSNANVANYLPTYTGNITAGNIAVTGNVTANWFVGNINTTNSLVTSGNITANNFIGSDPNVGLIAGNYTWLFDNAGNVTLPSNTFAVNYANGTAVSLGGTYSNADVANYLPTYNGNALFSNVTVSRDAVILGNLRVEGNTTYINVSDLIVEDKDIIVAANASATMTDLNGAGLQIGNRSAGGNITFFYNSTSNVMTLSHGANIANVLNVSGNITATGNVNTGNLVGSGTNVEIVGGSYTWTFNGSGNLVLPGNTFAVNYANGSQVSLAGSYSNTNVKAYLGNFDGNIIPSANVTYDLGSNSNRWNDLYLNNSTIYIGAQEITANADSTIFSGNIAVGNLVGTGDNVDIKAGAYTWRFDNAGNLTLPANTSAINYANGTAVPVGYGNASVAAYLGSNANLTILSQGNITGNYFIGNGALLTGVVTSSYSNANVANYLPTYTGNITAGNVTATGNVQGSYILGNGALLTGLPATYGNSNVAAYLASNANITLTIGTGNITTQGNLAVGNLIGSGDNVDLKAGSYTWRFDNTGNLTLPANSTAIYYANGTQVPVGYGNANVAAYLASNAALTILTTSNITTSANISGAYVLGNGALLTGLTATYGNSNVAAYLAAYNGNALFSNVTVSQDAVILGNLRVEGNTTYINVSDLIVEDKDIIVAANASATLTDLNGAGLQIGNRTAGGNITFFYNSTSNVMTLSHGANIANTLNVAGNVTATGNVNTGNLVGSGTNVEIVSGAYTWTFDGAGNLSGTGNVSAGNFVGTSGNTSIVTAGYIWTFNDAGNLVLPGNTFGVTYANGTTVSLGGSYSNADVANYLPTYTGNVTAGNISVTGNVTANWFVGNINTTNSLVTSGNITANNFIGSAANTRIVANIYTWTFDSAGNLSLPSNTFSVNYANGTAVNLGGSYSNADVANYLPTYTGNISAGNVTATGNVTSNNFVGSSGNTSIVTAGYTWLFDSAGNLVLPGNTFSVNYANGAQVALGSGSGSYSNANVQAYLGNFDGNIIPSANVTYNLGSNSNRWNDLYLNNSTIYIGAQEITANADSTVFSGNISANYVTANISTTGNITAGNFVGSAANTRIVASVYTWTFNSTGNLVLPGNTFSVNYANGTQVTLGGSSSYSNADVANYLPTFTGNVGAGNLNITGNIIDTGALNIITGASGNITLAPGNSNVLIARTTGANVTGTLGVTGNVDAGNFNVTGNIVDTGALTIITGASGNVTLAPGNTSVLIARTTGANVTGTLGVTGNITGGNITTTIVSATGNVSGGNITTTGVVTATGNITGGNIVTTGIVSATGNVNAGNLNVTGNIVDTGALNIVTGASGNVSLAPGNTSVLVATTTGVNVAGTLNTTGSFITSGNVTANNLIGTGVNTSIVSNNYTWTFNSEGNLVLPGNTFGVTYANGIAVSLGGGSAYGNSDVANYLASNANVTITVGVANITTQGNINSRALYLGSQRDVIYQVSGNITLAGGALDNNANISIRANTAMANSYVLSLPADTPNAGDVLSVKNFGSQSGVGNVANLIWSAPASTYGNTNVAAYLQTYNGNALFSNVTVSQDMVVLGNLRVEGNTTEINVSNIFLEDKDIIVAANASATLSDLNGAGLQIGNRTAGGNITFFYDSTSNVMALSHGANIANVLNVAGNISATGNVSGNYILGNGAFLTGLPATYGNSNVAAYLASNANITLAIGTGNITTQGNLAVGNLIGSGDNVEITAGAYTWTLDNTGNLTLPGNTTAIYYANGTQVPVGYGNANVATYLASNANVTVSVGVSNITTQGNISGNYFIGNGALLTGVVTSSYSNANVANYLPTYTGNVSAGNLNLTGNIVDTGAIFVITGASGNVVLAPNGTSRIIATTSGANVIGNLDVAGNVNANGATLTGNLSVGNLIGSGDNVEITAGAYTWTLDNTGNLILPGNATAIYYANGTQVPVGYGNANVATYLASNAAVTILTTGNITSNANIAGNYVLGNGAFLTGIAAGYANSNVKAYLGNFDGNIIPSANVTYDLGSNSNRWNDLYLNNSTIYIGSQEITANANATIFSGNISANYLLGNGALLTGVASSYGNANVADYLASNANITLAIGTGNITTQGNISVGSIQGSNANTTIVANVYSWTFDDTGNLTLPGNTTAIYYANGTQVPLGYNNASVASYMGSNAAITILTTANITTQGNIAGNFFIGNGSLLTGLPATYSNTNVAAYLASNANVTLSIGTGNITTQGNIKSRTLYLGSHQDVAYQEHGNITLSGGSADNASNVSIVANGAMTTNYVLKLPADTPNAGDVLTVKNFGSQLLFGNVANLIWSAPAGSYTNANVANYLTTYNGNALFSNVTVSQDAVILGNLRVEGNTTYINVSDLIVEDKDIIVAANASATMSDLNGAGLQIGNRSAGGNVTFFYNSTSNVMTLSHGANIANVLNVAGNITANSLTGTGSNVEIVGGSYTWTFNGSGNLVLPGNAFSVNYANGAQVSLGGSYSNAEAASYLASNANVTILTGVANITTQGNVTAGYFLGNATFADGVSNTYFGNVSPSSPAQGDIWINSDTAVQLIYFVDANGGQWAEMEAATSYSYSAGGDYTDSNVTALLASLGANAISSSANITTSANISAGYILANGSQLTGLDFTNYTNSNVANYLISYNANALFSNVTVSQDMVILGNLRVDGNTTEINVSNILLEDKDIIVAANASATLSDLNGAGLQIGNITAGGNITFFYNSTSNVMSLSHGANIANVLNVAGNISAANITATGNISGNTNGFTIGYRDVPQVSWSNATMALADASKHYYTSTGGVILTVPSNANVAFPIGATVAFYNRSSANCTIAPQASVNIFLVGNSTITPTANRTITSNGGGTLTKVDTNTWMLSAANVV